MVGGDRRVRALAVALASLGAAALAHRLAGERLPDPLLLALLALPATAVAAASSRCSFTTRAVLAGAGQLALHQAFMLLAGGRGMGAALVPSGGHAGHTGHVEVIAGQGVRASHQTLTATLLHALATGAVVLLAAFGERVLHGLLSAVRPRALTRPAIPVRARPAVLSLLRALVAVRPDGPLPARGPPALLGL